MNEPLLYAGDDARRLLGNIGKTTYFQLIADGKLKRVKIGAKTLVTAESIKTYVAGLTDA